MQIIGPIFSGPSANQKICLIKWGPLGGVSTVMVLNLCLLLRSQICPPIGLGPVLGEAGYTQNASARPQHNLHALSKGMGGVVEVVVAPIGE